MITQTLCLSTQTADGNPCQNLVAHRTYKCAAGHVPATRRFTTDNKNPSELIGSEASGTIDFDEMVSVAVPEYGIRARLATDNWPFNPTAASISGADRNAANSETMDVYGNLAILESQYELDRVNAEHSRVLKVAYDLNPELIESYPSGRKHLSGNAPQELRVLDDEMQGRRNILEKHITEMADKAQRDAKQKETVEFHKSRERSRSTAVKVSVDSQSTEELKDIVSREKNLSGSYQYRDSTKRSETEELMRLKEKATYAKEELERRGISPSAYLE